jgi:hypothetical protein
MKSAKCRNAKVQSKWKVPLAVVDLLDPGLNRIGNMTVGEARQRVLSADPAAVRAIDGSFALVASEGQTVRLARSMDRPMRYFLAKRREGPALYVADRIDSLREALAGDGLAGQFHPSYTRMVPAHYVVDLALVGCPDPDPIYTRFFTPERATLPTDLDEIGRYAGVRRSRSKVVDSDRRGRKPGQRRSAARADRGGVSGAATTAPCSW